MLILSRASSLLLLAIYLLYIFLQIRKTSLHRPAIHVSNPDGTASRSSRDTRASIALLFPRSIRFQDEEMSNGSRGKGISRKDSLELAPLDDPDMSHIGAEEENEHLVIEEPVDEADLAGQNRLWKTLSDRRAMSKHSIYQHPSRRHRSDSRASSQAPMSEDCRQRGDSQQRRSFAGSTSSLPHLLVGTSGSSLNAPDNEVVQDDNLRDIGLTASIVLLIVSSLLVAVCAEFLANTLDDIVSSGPFSEAFIGLIILPVAGNCAELITAVAVAAKGKFDLAIGVSVGSSVQISLFVTPLIVMAGWALNRAMTMYFGVFETVSLFATTFLVNVLILSGKPKLLEGSLLCACYFIIGVGAYLFPTPENRA